MSPNVMARWVFSLVENNKEKQGRKFWLNILIQMPQKYAECGLKCYDATLKKSSLEKMVSNGTVVKINI